MKKTVAIVTMHRVLNYGSILQAIALHHYIKSLGYDSNVIDYHFPNEYHKSLSGSTLTEKISRIRAHVNGLCNRILRTDLDRKVAGFSEYINKYLNLTRPYLSETALAKEPVIADIYVTGSDQVWNPRWVGTDLTYFLSWVPVNSKSIRISYGASFGVRNIDSAQLQLIVPWLKKYKAISVREENEILPKIGLSNNVVLDPTFLLDKFEWSKFIDASPLIEGKYILCYLIGYSFNPFPYADNVVKYIHKKLGYKVVMIGGEPINMLRGYKLINDCTPAEFLNLFYNASYIVTSSFHGTAFAINFGIPFTSIIDNESDNDNRQVSLVNCVGLNSEGIIVKGQKLDDISLMSSDTVSPLLEKMRTASRQFLIKSLSDK